MMKCNNVKASTILTRKNKLLRSAVILVGIAYATACSIVPEPIEVAENETLVPFETISSLTQNIDPSNQQTQLPQAGDKARWGGKIVSVENKKDVSEIEIVFFPENNYGKPRTGEASLGRFKAVVKGFVDPIVFEQGRLITIVGEVSDAQTGIIGEQAYLYPTLNALGYHMWKETSEVEIDSFHFAPFGYYHYAGFNRSIFSPWYDPWHFRNNRQRIRIIHNNGHEQGRRVGGVSPATPSGTASPVTRARSSGNISRPSSPRSSGMLRPSKQRNEVDK